MNSLERVLALINGQTLDFLPVFPMLNEYASKILGISEGEYYKRPELLAEGQMLLVKRFKYDFLLAFTFLAREAAAVGSKIAYYEDGSPTIASLLAKDCQDILKIEIPNFEENPETKVVLEQINKLTKLSEEQYPIVGVATGPFSWPTLIMGNENWLTALFMEEPETIKSVLERSLEFSSNWANAQLNAGAHMIAIVEGSATKSVIPEDVFIQFVKPMLSQLVRKIKGPIILMGVGGELEAYLRHIEECGVAGVVISNDDSLEDCLKSVKDLVIVGNINNIEFPDYSLEDIENICQYALKIGKGKKYILSTQYVIPSFTNEKLIDKLVECARAYGKY